MKTPPVEEFARELAQDAVASVRRASKSVTVARRERLAAVFQDPDRARLAAAEIKSYVLDNLGSLLKQLEENAQANGIQVHWAQDAASANAAILEICHRVAQGALIAKAKSMATEEIELNEALHEAGYHPVETDLGEFVVQIDGDRPSHIVAPIIHKNRFQVAASFAREGLGPYTEDPRALTHQARAHLRDVFRKAGVGISGVNFAIAETGRIVLVENEGNNRFSTTAPRIHIAVMGIEKILPRESDLPLFLRLLAGSATGQHLTVYTHLISGPRQAGELDGPDEVHLVLLDNGRTHALSGPYRDILRCLRCGACLNVCPVYRQVSGHAYRNVYPGPLGAVLASALWGVEKYGDLAKASTLCGACREVCPVDIPIPDMLLRLRDEATKAGIKDGLPWAAFGAAATSSGLWKKGLKMLPMAGKLPGAPPLPPKQGRNFRRWWNERS